MYPLGETITFAVVFSNFKERNSPYKVYILGILIGGLMLLIISATNILVLGVNIASIYFHPTYITMSRITFGSTIQRVESIMSIAYILGAFIKISIYLLVTTKAITKIFNFEDYRFLVINAALFMLILSHFLFGGVSELWEYTLVWYYFAILFQIIFPILLFIVAEFRKKQLKTN